MLSMIQQLQAELFLHSRQSAGCQAERLQLKGHSSSH